MGDAISEGRDAVSDKQARREGETAMIHPGEKHVIIKNSKPETWHDIIKR